MVENDRVHPPQAKTPPAAGDSLAGRVAVVTGASRGIGRVIALRLAAEGARVQAIARDRDRLDDVVATARAHGGQMLATAADVTDVDAMRAAAERVRTEWSVPDLVIANAGLLGAIGHAWEIDFESWWRDVEVNLRGTALTCTTYLPSMIEAGRGRLVLFGGGGTTSAFPGASGYAVAKAAIARLAESLDIELGESGVHAFAVSPGFVHTDMTETFARTEAGRRFMGSLAERLETGRTTPPGNAAELVLRIAWGDLDALHGRFLHAASDLDRLDDLRQDAARIVAAGERVLRMPGLEP